MFSESMNVDFGAVRYTLLEQPRLLFTAFVLSFFVVLYGFKHHGGGEQKKKRPPLVPYRFPWVGSALDMGKDPDSFFKNASDKLGPVFRVKAIGRETTYITSAELISSVYRDVKTFDFTSIRLEMSHKVFGLSLEATYSQFTRDHFFPAHHRGLSPKSVIILLERYTEHVREEILRVVGQNENVPTLLAPFLVPLAYSSVAHAFFGRSFDAAKSYKSFRRFDEYFHIIAAGVPRFLIPGPHRAWEELGSMFETYLQNPHEDCCEFLLDLERAARDEGWSVQDIAKSMASDLWAMEANATWAGYWIIALELQKPQGLASLVAEVDLSRQEWKAKSPNELLGANLHVWLSNADLPLLSSAIQESLRLSTSTFSIRRVNHPTVFEGYHFEAGEQIICVTRAVHLDEEIHHKAQEFLSDRYVNGQRKPAKKGKFVPNHSMPFGGGVSMCEGRHFALGELKIFIALLLSYATIELDTNSSARPTYYKQRMGAGVMPAQGDLRVKITKRNVI